MKGTYNEMQASNLDFAKSFLLMNEVENSKNDLDSNNTDQKIHLERQASIISVTPAANGKSKYFKDSLNPIEEGESRSSGNVSLSVYLSYILAGGGNLKIMFFVLISLLTQVSISGGDLWITYWYDKYLTI